MPLIFADMPLLMTGSGVVLDFFLHADQPATSILKTTIGAIFLIG
jgi:hypothetical protein